MLKQSLASQTRNKLCPEAAGRWAKAGASLPFFLCLQWASPSAMFLEKEVGGRRKSGPTNVFLLSHDPLLGMWLGAWNETRKPLIYIIC